MKHNPEQVLKLIFGNLDSFSIPGVGTFIREKGASDINRAAGVIAPPSVGFHYEDGDEYLGDTLGFIISNNDCSIADGEDLLLEVSDWIKSQMGSGKCVIDGVGALKADNFGDYSFENESGLLQTGDEVFGLGSLKFTLGEKQYSTEEKKESALKSADNLKTKVEEPAPVVKRKVRPAVIILLVLVLLLSGGGIIWPEQYKNVLISMGLLSGGKNGGDQELISENNNSEVDTDSNNEANGEEVVMDHNEQVEQPVIEDKDNEVKPVYKSGAVSPVAGQYYLIVSSTSYPGDAGYLAKNLKTGFPEAKVIKPYGGKPFYRVSLFNSTDKEAVIEKMVNLKSKFPGSWIFWTGM